MVEVHLEWGPRAVEVFGGWADVVVVVDVLSFSTAVAVSRGAAVVPCAVDRAEAERLGAQLGAQVAVPRGKTSPVRPYSLSPVSLASLPANSAVVPSSPPLTALAERPRPRRQRQPSLTLLMIWAGACRSVSLDASSLSGATTLTSPGPRRSTSARRCRCSSTACMSRHRLWGQHANRIGGMNQVESMEPEAPRTVEPVSSSNCAPR